MSISAPALQKASRLEMLKAAKMLRASPKGEKFSLASSTVSLERASGASPVPSAVQLTSVREMPPSGIFLRRQRIRPMGPSASVSTGRLPRLPTRRMPASVRATRSISRHCAPS